MQGYEETETFARHVREVPSVRRFVRAALAGHPEASDAELLACELATNAVRHACDAAKVTVTVAVSGMTVHVAVVDDGIAGVPHWRDPADDDDAEGGRGFRLVNELAARWGFLREKAQARTCLWFELGSGGPA